jgi:hypothetical protein
VQRDVPRVETVQRRAQPVADGHAGAPVDTGFEQAIEHDQHATKIAAHVGRVAGVVHPVV